jgi:hypothetical protein
LCALLCRSNDPTLRSGCRLLRGRHLAPFS